MFFLTPTRLEPNGSKVEGSGGGRTGPHFHVHLGTPYQVELISEYPFPPDSTIHFSSRLLFLLKRKNNSKRALMNEATAP